MWTIQNSFETKWNPGNDIMSPQLDMEIRRNDPLQGTAVDAPESEPGWTGDRSLRARLLSRKVGCADVTVRNSRHYAAAGSRGAFHFQHFHQRDK